MYEVKRWNMNTLQLKSDQYISKFNCLTFVLSLEKETYPENSHMFCIAILN